MGDPEDEPGPELRAALDALRGRLLAETPQAAELAHGLAGLLDASGELAAAEILHRRAGVLIAGFPTGDELDARRIQWARGLAGNLLAQGRTGDARAVLRAAAMLADALLGPDDQETAATLATLGDLGDT